ncbi:methyltransferase domain protein [Ceratobasidium sp. AG-Ba]|nr:methyltransferase domain protein [Ceratobasidium sp. AG-Ba]
MAGATRAWDDATEAEVWYVEPETASKDGYPVGYTYPSDTESTTDTMETIRSNEVGDFFRVEHGRAFPMYDELPMALPSDIGEIRRLQIQYTAIKMLIGDTFDTIMDTHLAPSPDQRRKQVLDVRTQTGLWADEIAVRFPHVDVKTVDLAPTIPHMPRANLHHEVYDIHAGIMEPENTFDIIHARHTINMIKDWRTLLKDMHRVLRPGGILIFGELDPRLTVPDNYAPALVGPGGRSAAFFEQYRAALSNEGVLVESCKDIDTWLSPQHAMWATEPGSGFYDIQHQSWEAPLNGLWHPDPRMQEVGMLMAMNFCEFTKNARPLFLSSGLSDSEFDNWIEDTWREARDPMNNLVIRYHAVLARKI